MPVHLEGVGLTSFIPVSIRIGLINNMPDRALKRTERQFRNLLESAADGLAHVQLSMFALPEIQRSEPASAHIGRFYSPVQKLWDSQLDALIVTGTEPHASDLTHEHYWETLTKIVDWANHNTCSTIWSCLAAHAAVLYKDGIERRRLTEKRFGVFECRRGSDHSLTAGLPTNIHVPHSRWNDLPCGELTGRGYDLLTCAADGSADAFAKQFESLFIFFQGHPEYDPDTLLLEYRRDVGRYLKGERDAHPPLPRGYFDSFTEVALTRLHDQAQSDPRPELLKEFPLIGVEKRTSEKCSSAAYRIYRNWLTHLCAEKHRKGRRNQPAVFAIAKQAG